MAKKRPVRKPGESVKEYRARLAKWEAQQAGNLVRGAASAAKNFLMGKPKVGKPDSSLTAWRQNDASGTNSITGKKEKEKKTETTTTSSSSGPRKVKYPVQIGKVEEKPKTTSSGSGSSSGGGSRGGSSGSSGSSSSSSSGSSSTPKPKPKPKPQGQGSQGFRKGDKDLGKATGITASGSKTEPPKPKSRLEKALSGIGKWEEPKKKETRKKPTSRFLKKTNNTRRK